MMDLYLGAKFGVMNVAAALANDAAWKLYKLKRPSNVGRALYILRPVIDIRVLQGNGDILGTDATTTLLKAGGYYPITVENIRDEYLSIRSNTASGGNLEITCGSEVEAWSLITVA